MFWCFMIDWRQGTFRTFINSKLSLSFRISTYSWSISQIYCYFLHFSFWTQLMYLNFIHYSLSTHCINDLGIRSSHLIICLLSEYTIRLRSFIPHWYYILQHRIELADISCIIWKTWLGVKLCMITFYLQMIRRQHRSASGFWSSSWLKI